METITIRIPEDVLQSIDREADEQGVSRSEYIRELIEKGRKYDALKLERDQLEERFIYQRNERQDLIAYIEEMRSRHSASLLKRLKWLVFGKDR